MSTPLKQWKEKTLSLLGWRQYKKVEKKKVGKKEEKLALNEPSFNSSFGFFPLIFPPRAYTASSLVAMSYG